MNKECDVKEMIIGTHHDNNYENARYVSLIMIKALLNIDFLPHY